MKRGLVFFSLFGGALLHGADVSALRDYWFEGTAEISSYRLERERYGEMREGHAILLFVTEPFLPEKQVKAEGGQAEAVPVLKLNYTENFQTGVYPYGMMLSVFTEFPRGEVDWADGLSTPLKVASTVHEWCGLVYGQLNRRVLGYQYRGFSYFEAEGDVDVALPLVPVRDGLFNQIRLAAQSLAQGESTMLPGLFYHRLRHQPLQAEAVRVVTASAQWMKQVVQAYTVQWLESGRQWTVYYEKAFPHKILGWQEWEGGKQVARARLYKTIKSDYWNKSANTFEGVYRDLIPPSQ